METNDAPGAIALPESLERVVEILRHFGIDCASVDDLSEVCGIEAAESLQRLGESLYHCSNLLGEAQALIAQHAGSAPEAMSWFRRTESEMIIARDLICLGKVPCMHESPATTGLTRDSTLQPVAQASAAVMHEGQSRH